MNARWTRRRFAACAAAALGGAMTGCGGGPSRVDETALKISYFRSVNDARTKRPVPVYRVVMSNSWRDVMGDSPREPFPRAAGRGVYVGYLPDRDLQKYVGLLRKFGIGSLAARKPESYEPNQLAAQASNAAMQKVTRIITVGTPREHWSYDVRDQAPGSQSTSFLECEKFVMRVVEYSLNIQTGAQPFMPGKR